MVISTRRLRTQEKKLRQKIILTLLIFVGATFLFAYVVLPIMAKLAVGLSSLRKESDTGNSTSQAILLPPTLEPATEATNSSRLTITGFASVDTYVIIYRRDVQLVKTPVDKDGKFSSKITLVEGENQLTVVTYKDEKVSNPVTLTIIYKSNPPTLDITSPKDGDSFSEDEKDITLEGTTDPDNKVTVNDRLAIVDPQGNFSLSVSLSDGENAFKIVATDDAGNSSELEMKLHYSP